MLLALWGALTVSSSLAAELSFPDVLRPALGEVVPALVGLVQSPDARDDENLAATENAVSALGARRGAASVRVV